MPKTSAFMSTPIKHFEGISESEFNVLLKAPAQITVLIAAADGNIAASELNAGNKLVGYRTFTSETALHTYYEVVHERFESDLHEVLGQIETQPSDSLNGIIATLGTTTPILAKLDAGFAHTLLNSWQSLAKKVAESHGGLFGFATIDEAEAKLINLPMISLK